MVRKAFFDAAKLRAKSFGKTQVSHRHPQVESTFKALQKNLQQLIFQPKDKNTRYVSRRFLFPPCPLIFHPLSIHCPGSAG